MTHAERLAAMRARNQKPPRVPLPDVKAYWLARWAKAVENKNEIRTASESLANDSLVHGNDANVQPSKTPTVPQMRKGQIHPYTMEARD
jgi:hypothetical protein